MCGRFAFYSSAQQVKRQFDIQFSLDFAPRYNLCPGQSISVLAYESGTVKAKNVSWGFEPKWGDTKTKLIINARAEFVHPRSPLLLTRKQISSWLSDVSFSFVSQTAIDEFDTQALSCYQVSSKVNNVRNDYEDLIVKYNGF